MIPIPENLIFVKEDEASSLTSRQIRREKIRLILIRTGYNKSEHSA